MVCEMTIWQMDSVYIFGGRIGNCLEAVFTTSTDCDVTERPMMPIPMSGTPDIGDSLGRQDLASDCDRNRGLRPTPRGRPRSPARRNGSGAGDFAALPA